MECPICGSTAVVAVTCSQNAVELAQRGVDPYDLLFNENSKAECRICGEIFDAPADSPGAG